MRKAAPLACHSAAEPGALQRREAFAIANPAGSHLFLCQKVGTILSLRRVRNFPKPLTTFPPPAPNAGSPRQAGRNRSRPECPTCSPARPYFLPLALLFAFTAAGFAAAGRDGRFTVGGSVAAP